MLRGQYVGSVALTPEVRRVAALPRVDWSSRDDAQDIVARYTQRFRVSGGTHTLLFDTTSWPSGMYFARLSINKRLIGWQRFVVV